MPYVLGVNSKGTSTTSPNIDSTGASIEFIAVGHFGLAVGGDITDSAGNTGASFTRDGQEDNDAAAMLFRKFEPITSTTHNVAVGLSRPGIVLAFFTGGNSPLQTFVGVTSGNSSVTSLQHASGVTPISENQLSLAVLGHRPTSGAGSISSLAISDDYTIIQHSNSGFTSTGGPIEGCALAYKLNPTKGVATNPQWTWIGSCTASAVLNVYYDPGEIKTMQGIVHLPPDSRVLKKVQGFTVTTEAKTFQGFRF